MRPKVDLEHAKLADSLIVDQVINVKVLKPNPSVIPLFGQAYQFR